MLVSYRFWEHSLRLQGSWVHSSVQALITLIRSHGRLLGGQQLTLVPWSLNGHGLAFQGDRQMRVLFVWSRLVRLVPGGELNLGFALIIKSGKLVWRFTALHRI